MAYMSFWGYLELKPPISELLSEAEFRRLSLLPSRKSWFSWQHASTALGNTFATDHRRMEMIHAEVRLSGELYFINIRYNSLRKHWYSDTETDVMKQS